MSEKEALIDDFNKFEIVIIDDGSTQDNKKMIESLNLKPHLNYHFQENSGPAKARNQGIKKAKGEYIIFIDDDIIVNNKFIEIGNIRADLSK